MKGRIFHYLEIAKRRYRSTEKRSFFLRYCGECKKIFPSLKSPAFFCCLSHQAKFLAKRRWKEGHGTGFKKGHPMFLKNWGEYAFQKGHKPKWTLAIKRKLIRSISGKKNPNWGRIYSVEERRNLSERLRAYRVSHPNPFVDVQLFEELNYNPHNDGKLNEFLKEKELKL